MLLLLRLAGKTKGPIAKEECWSHFSPSRSPSTPSLKPLSFHQQRKHKYKQHTQDLNVNSPKNKTDCHTLLFMSVIGI